MNFTRENSPPQAENFGISRFQNHGFIRGKRLEKSQKVDENKEHLLNSENPKVDENKEHLLKGGGLYSQ